MKKSKPKKPETVNSAGWIEIEPKGVIEPPGSLESLEVRIGSCVVSVSPGFDKPLFVEVCKVLQSL